MRQLQVEKCAMAQFKEHETEAISNMGTMVGFANNLLNRVYVNLT